MAWTRDDAAHLLRRAGFGGTLSEVDALFAAGQPAAIDSLLNYAAVADPVWDDPNPLLLPLPLESNYDARRNLLYKLLSGKRSLQSRLLWFWHGHFTTHINDTNAVLMTRQMENWRQLANGNFLDFLLAMYKDGAMLQYLNGDRNIKRQPNENFARENWELFTTGVGPYDEMGVREAARAFTGYQVTADNLVVFNANQHDSGVKNILGMTGTFGGDEVMSITFSRPETMWRICTKLYKHFVSERLNLVELNNLIRAWTSSGGNIGAVMMALLRSPGFWDPRNRGFLVKSAPEYGIGLVQRLELPVDVGLVNRLMRDLEQMGQSPFEPPNVAGYPTGVRLLGASMLLARYRFAYNAIYQRNPGGVMAVMTTGLPTSPSREQLVATLAQRLGVVNLGANTRTAINDYLGTDAINTGNLQSKTLGALYLLACSPEFQLT